MKLSSNMTYVMPSFPYFSPLPLLFNLICPDSLANNTIKKPLLLREEICNKMCNTLCIVTSLINII